jgi:hypothetical protein
MRCGKLVYHLNCFSCYECQQKFVIEFCTKKNFFFSFLGFVWEIDIFYIIIKSYVKMIMNEQKELCYLLLLRILHFFQSKIKPNEQREYKQNIEIV